MGKAFGKIIGNILFFVFLGTIVFVGFTKLIEKSDTFSIGNYSVYTVLTPSMHGTFEAGSIIFVKKVPESDLKVGDIITFYPVEDNATVLTHRIVNIEEDDIGAKRYVTQGDANNVEDRNPVTYKEIIGKTVGWVNNVGNVLRQLRSPFGVGAIIAATAGFLIFSNIIEKNKKERELKGAAGKNKAIGRTAGNNRRKSMQDADDPIGYSINDMKQPDDFDFPEKQKNKPAAGRAAALGRKTVIKKPARSLSPEDQSTSTKTPAPRKQPNPMQTLNASSHSADAAVSRLAFQQESHSKQKNAQSAAFNFFGEDNYQDSSESNVSLVNQNGQKIKPPGRNKPVRNPAPAASHSAANDPFYFTADADKTRFTQPVRRIGEDTIPLPRQTTTPLEAFPSPSAVRTPAPGRPPEAKPSPWLDACVWNANGTSPDNPKEMPAALPGAIDHPTKIVPRPALFLTPQSMNADES